MYDTIIIGAGMSGLAAGIRLAHFDQKVCILERHNTIGGLNSFYRLRGRDYDVGLHAVTNYAKKGIRGPLSTMLRQLRFKWEEFALAEQVGSRIAFPDVDLKFTNDIEVLRSQIADKFPDQIDGFDKLRGLIINYDDLDQENYEQSSREILGNCISDPMLIEMLFCPLMWYGNAREHDMDFGQFSIMFRSIFVEGFCRPYKGVRLILKNLVKRFRSLGGELLLRKGVNRIVTDNRQVTGVELDNGDFIEGRHVLSSAGRLETLRMCDDSSEVDPRQAGQLAFCETISILDKQPKDVGIEDTIVFFNDSERFNWTQTDQLCDLHTGVFCSPNNYQYTDEEGDLAEGVLRITAIANFEKWSALDEQQYQLAKLHWYDRLADSAIRFVPDYRHHVIDTDMFTPTTVRRFTWHDNGAIYGAPDKKLDGTTHLDNLYLCGTDQGYVGIIGAIISGISMANRHCLTR